MRFNGLILCSLAAAFFAGCAQRSLPAVRESGDRHFNKGDFASAAADYREYTDRKPGEAAVQNQYAKTLLALGQPVPAVERATIAFDQQPTNEDFIETRAQALFEAKKTDELYRFLRGQCDGRGKPADFIRLGRFSQMLGDADGAELAMLTAARIDGGKTIEPQLALANFYRTIGDRNKELTRLRTSLYVDPKNVEVQSRIRAMGEVPGPTFALSPNDVE